MSITRCLALDVECVGKQGGSQSQAARVSVVNEYLECLIDTYVAPLYHITDYRTPVSGIRSYNLTYAPNFWTVREDVRAMIKGNVLVGHSVEHDLKVLRLSHPDWNIRDTASYPPFVEMNRNRTPSLRWLARKVLNRSIQNGEHNSVEDARATMQIYKRVKEDWEDWLEEEDESSEDEYSSSEEEEYYSSSEEEGEYYSSEEDEFYNN